MKYCTQCGSVMKDDDMFCSSCGAKAKDVNVSNSGRDYFNDDEDETVIKGYNKRTKPSGLAQVAKVLMIIATVINGITFIIPLFWCIPMTKRYSVATRNGGDVGVAFKVCTIIFVSPLAGILMLIDEGSK